MIQATFAEEYVAVVQGNRDVNQELLQHRYDIIFFTGSPSLGRTVMSAAARNLTPVVLELGGKSPCIVDNGADVEMAARRIAWGKTLNAGQTCIAPDYLLIHSSLQDKFIEAFRRQIRKLHGDDVRTSPHFVRMVNDKAFDRVAAYMNDGRVVAGGRMVREERFIEPTLLADVEPTSPVMQEEIFGPVLPMICFEELNEVIRFVTEREKPLAFYYFGPEKEGRRIIAQTTSGGACINDTIMHIANENLPFGGVGNSGMGCYHGWESFNAFSHRRAVVTTPTWLDLPFRYMPYKMFGLVKKIL
jgi:aldehyde dehydrogenase (NAD+)